MLAIDRTTLDRHPTKGDLMHTATALPEPYAASFPPTAMSGPRPAPDQAAASSGYGAALAALRAEYEQDAGAALDQLQQWLDRLEQSPTDAAALREVMRCFHSYAGSGATYGFPGVTAIGNEGEGICAALQAAGAPPSGSDIDRLRRLREALGRELTAGATSKVPDGPDGALAVPEAAAEPAGTPAKGPAAAVPAVPGEAPAGRVLLVEDDPFQARFVRLTLETAGYQVTVCDDPRRFTADLAACRPELVLMDIMLPGASGYELVRWLRHERTSATLPVLFLTAEGQMQARLESAWSGGDDHLVKPLSPATLLAAVAGRVERCRRATLLVERDPVTHALPESKLLQRAAAAVERQRREPHRRISWVAIELDHFWSIQDCYGEPTANRVLAATAALLRRELGQGSSLGRCDGPRLAVLLDGVRPRQALQMIDRLRQKFAAQEHRSAAGDHFRTTFSAGVAALAPEMSVEQWRHEAERGLRVARSAGRNRVELVR
jgi:diguanylate cyclase (GGDEF)-like protein